MKTFLKIVLLFAAYLLNSFIFTTMYTISVVLVYLFVGIILVPVIVIVYPTLSTFVFRAALRKSKLKSLSIAWSVLNVVTGLMLIQEIGYGWSEERELLYVAFALSFVVTAFYNVATYKKDSKEGVYLDGSEENR